MKGQGREARDERRVEREQDLERRHFLHALDMDPEIEVSDWEAEFIENTYTRHWFTPKQREVIDRMRDKYNVKDGDI